MGKLVVEWGKLVFGSDVMELFGYPWWAIVLVCGGVFLAALVDAIGGGGGLISLPVYLLVGLPYHSALGTNKMSSCIGTAASTFRYLKSGFVNWGLAVGAIVLALTGSYLGTTLQLHVDETYLQYTLLAVLPIVAAVMLLRKKELPEEPGKIRSAVQRAIVWGSSFVIGIYDGFYGPGTGTFLLLVYCYLGKMDVRTASGNVKLTNLASNVGGFATALFAGKVIVPIGLLAAVFSIAGHYLGAGLNIKNGSKIVRPVILIVLALLVVKVVTDMV